MVQYGLEIYNLLRNNLLRTLTRAAFMMESSLSHTLIW